MKHIRRALGAHGALSLDYFQNGRCYLCGLHMSRRKRKSEQVWRASTDHIVPLSLDGSNYMPNIALAHRKCNEEKGSRMPFPCEVLYGQALALRASVYLA